MKITLMNTGGWITGTVYLMIALLLIANRRLHLSLPLLYLATLYLPLIPLHLPVRMQIITTIAAYLIYLALWIGTVMLQKDIYVTGNWMYSKLWLKATQISSFQKSCLFPAIQLRLI
jgi:hypothetical protein